MRRALAVRTPVAVSRKASDLALMSKEVGMLAPVPSAGAGVPHLFEARLAPFDLRHQGVHPVHIRERRVDDR